MSIPGPRPDEAPAPPATAALRDLGAGRCAHGRALGSLLGGCLVGLSVSANGANVGPVATLLARRYGTGLGVIGLLTTVLFFGELVAMVPGGRAIDRYGAKRMGLAGIVVSLGGNLLLLTTTSPGLVLLFRAVTGVGMGVGFVAGAIYAQSPGGRGVGFAGVYGGAALGGGGLALAVVPQVVGSFGWRAPYVVVAAICALAIPVVAVCPPTRGRIALGGTPPLRVLLADRLLARLGAVMAVSFGFSVIIGNWVVTLLERTRGLSSGSAGAIGSLILILAMVGRPAGGLLVRSRPGGAWRSVAASCVLVAAGTAFLALSINGPLDVVGVILAGFAAGIPFGATLVGTTRMYPSSAGAAVGAVNIYPILAIVCGAPLVGLTFGLPGQGRIGFAVLSGLAVAAVAAIPWRLQLNGRD